jgi:hypothetical protein
MRQRITNLMLIASVVGAFGAMPAVSAAKHGADDNKPAKKVDDKGGHGRGADDPAGHR